MNITRLVPIVLGLILIKFIFEGSKYICSELIGVTEYWWVYPILFMASVCFAMLLLWGSLFVYYKISKPKLK